MNFDKLFEVASSKGVEDLQIYFVDSNEFEIGVFKSELETYTIANTQKLSVKGIYEGKMGTVTTEVLTDDVIDFLVDSVIASAKTIESEDEVFIYEGDKEYKKIKGIYNESLNNVTAKQKIIDSYKLEELIKSKDERIKMAQVFYQDGSNHVRIINSKGLNLEKLVNDGIIGAQVVANDGKDQRSAFEYTRSNDYSDFNLENLASLAVEKAVALLGATPCKSGEYEILLTKEASSSLLAPHVSMFSAESVQKNVSLLKGKIGKVIGSTKISIIDDPFMEKSVKSGAFDDEGVATTYKELVKEGILTGFMHNLKTAKKDDVKSTGNSFIGRGIAPTNLYIKPGNFKYEDAIKIMKKGIVITDLAGTHAGANPISGDFSLQASGFLVENGEIIRPVALITVAGNYLDLLKDVTQVCDDLKFNFSYVGSPSLLIKSLMVSGL